MKIYLISFKWKVTFSCPYYLDNKYMGQISMNEPATCLLYYCQPDVRNLTLLYNRVGDGRQDGINDVMVAKNRGCGAPIPDHYNLYQFLF